MNQLTKISEELSPVQREMVLTRSINNGLLKEEDIGWAIHEMQRHPNWDLIILENKGFDMSKALSTCQNLPQKFEEVFPKTETEAIDSSLPSLATIYKYKGKTSVISFLISIISKVSEILNVGGNISDDQLRPIAENIYGQFYHLNIAEIKKAVNNGLRSKTYRLDAGVFIVWLSDFQDLKIKISKDRSLSAHYSRDHKIERLDKYIGAKKSVKLIK